MSKRIMTYDEFYIESREVDGKTIYVYYDNIDGDIEEVKIKQVLDITDCDYSDDYLLNTCECFCCGEMDEYQLYVWFDLVEDKEF